MKERRQRLPLRRLILWGVGLALLALLALALRPQPLPVDLAKVARGPLQVTIDEEGETRVRERFVVSAPLPGRVLRIELEPGDPVVAHDTVLATFQPMAPTLLDARTRAEASARVKAAQAALGLAEAERDRIQAELRHAQAEHTRYRKLAQEQVVSQERLDSAELQAKTLEGALRAGEFAIRSRQHELEVVRASLVEQPAAMSGPSARPIELRSPIDGVVLKRWHESEAIVLAGEPLLEVADPKALEVVSDLLSADAVKVRPGQQVRFEQWGSERALSGRVRRIEPSGFTKISALGVEEQRVNVVMDFTDPYEAWQALGDGYRVEIKIVIWEQESVLKVPTSSLFRHGEQWAVYTREDGKAVLRPLELGQRNGREAEILSGLAEGVEVVVHPSDDIKPAVALTPRSL